jgi:hypothetical protein
MEEQYLKGLGRINVSLSTLFIIQAREEQRVLVELVWRFED